MWNMASRDRFGSPQFRRDKPRLHRAKLVHVLWLLPLAAVLAGSALVYARFHADASMSGVSVHSVQGVPADLFIESVVKGDGSLGWHQLCPSVQSQLPLAELVQQANTLRNDARQNGVTFSSDFIGARPRPAGGNIRVYVVTAHWPNGATQLRTYSVLTQGSGCVEDVQTQ